MPWLQTTCEESSGHFSPDGNWIAFCSNESGRLEVYVRSFTGASGSITAGKWPVSINGGESPQWSHDGKELFFKSPEGKLMRVSVKTGATFETRTPVALFDTHRAAVSYDLNPDGRFLLSRA